MGKRAKIAEELNRARHRRAALDKRIKELEEAFTQTENTEILGIVHAYNLTPEELEKLMARLAKNAPGHPEKEEGNQ